MVFIQLKLMELKRKLKLNYFNKYFNYNDYKNGN